ncbi:MAG: LysM peptidoglycan-binding domain-containing protein [Chitinophagales bacterium]
MGSSRQVMKIAVGSMLVVFLAPGLVVAKKATTTKGTNAGSSAYTVQSGDTLYLIAQRTGTTVDALRSANGLSADVIYPGQSLVLPSASSSAGSTSGSTGTRYTVQSGDTLYLIAQRNGTTVAALQQANGLSAGTWLYPGETLVIPKGGATGGTGSTSGSSGSYTVQPGDSLFFIAARYGTTVTALEQANGITAPENLRVGQTLVIPGTTSTPTPSPSGQAYTVQAGDTLFLIAQRYGTTVAALQQTNGLTNPDSLYAGQRLTIPSGSTATPAPAPSPTPATGDQTYTVQSGDTLYLIAQRYKTTVDALVQANHITDVNNLAPGTVLQIPAASTPATNASGQIVEPGIDLSTAVWGSKYVISQQDYDLLARLVSAEAQGEPYDGQVAVAATVLHRMTDPRFPNTVNDIIYQGVGTAYPQYSPVYDGAINNPAVPSAYQAVKDALNGVDPSNGANGFYNPTGTENTWVRSQPVTVTIGNHIFFAS